ncbi:Rho GTPase activation protein [Cristinia sonorae]|uniref:Rho GTPase activation protein n=1 Tax=Cristinia sonorae TaxID=1940300 RepID=A0A8K0UJT3_9AGAR|nr:Rho GTPase activation protein [Cristinia sonorae]
MPNPLSLKQRLAALSMPSSSSTNNPYSNSSYDNPPQSPRSPAPRLRAFFNPNSQKRTMDNAPETSYSQDKLQEVMTRLIFQAGVDYETRPMVVMNASALPDPREVSYDQLLVRILAYLNLYVESDYTVVFLAAGSKNTPGWNWVWKAYRSLSRKYRKNLKRLYVVHSNFFTKMLFSLAGAIISPKFFRKITYIDTLSELAYHVPLTQIDIPPAVYQENMKYEREIKMPVPTRADLFGVPLDELMGYGGEKGGIPRVVKDCILFLRESGMQEEGLFRRSPSSALLRQVQQAYDRGHVVSLDTFGDPHLAAVLLKKYLRDLPDPLFPESTYSTIRRCPMPTNDPGDMASVMYIRETLLPELAPCAYILLSHILHLLHEVSLRSAYNRMDAHNLAVVICPNMVKSSSPIRDVAMCGVPGGPTLYPGHQPPQPQPQAQTSNTAALTEGKTTLGGVIKLCIQRYYEIFDELPDRAEALPPRRARTIMMVDDDDDDGLPPPGVRNSVIDDDEDIDDEMLVMPLGPGGGGRGGGGGGSSSSNRGGGGGGASSPPTAWTSSTTSSSPFSSTGHRPSSSKDLKDWRSTTTGHNNNNNYNNTTGYQTPTQTHTQGRAKSMISIDKGEIVAGTMRRGSISVGQRGTVRGKASGSGVEAMGVTASGFFSAPDGAPPVPPVPPRRR